MITDTCLLEVVICPDCNGEGQFWQVERHNKDGSLIESVCRACNGSGKLIKKTSITFEPWTANGVRWKHKH